MTQNRIAMTFQPDRLERIDGSLAALEADLDLLIALNVEERQDLVKMGHKSRAFCATALSVAEQHAGLMPRDFDIGAFRQDHLALELLRPRAARLAHLMQRMADTELALGSDLMAAALEVYGALKVAGKDKGVDEARRERHCCKVSDEAAFCLIQRPYVSKTLLTRRISPRGSP